MAYGELSKPTQNQNFNFNGLESILVMEDFVYVWS